MRTVMARVIRDAGRSLRIGRAEPAKVLRGKHKESGVRAEISRVQRGARVRGIQLCRCENPSVACEVKTGGQRYVSVEVHRGPGGEQRAPDKIQ